MCGIAAVVASNDAELQELSEAAAAVVSRRGPNHLATWTFDIGSGRILHLTSAVLHLRGSTMCQQPVVDEHGNVLLWNGEVFDGVEVPNTESDTTYVSKRLAAISDNSDDLSTSVVDAFAPICGPFAFCWFHAATRTLFYGRDRWGRRSLVSTRDSLPFVVASASLDEREYNEIVCTGIFSVPFSASEPVTPVLHPWKSNNPFRTRSLNTMPSYLSALSFAEDAICRDDAVLASARGLLEALNHSVARRVESIPRGNSNNAAQVGVLFSGGLDSVVLAALTHFHLPSDEPVDLFNICFDKNHDSPDRKAALASWAELKHLFPTRTWNFLAIDIEPDEVAAQQPHILNLMRPCKTHMDFNIGAAFWFLSRGIGRILTSNPMDTTDQRESQASFQLFGPFETKPTTCPSNNCTRKVHQHCQFQLCRPCCTKVTKFGHKLLRQEAHPQELASVTSTLLDMGIAQSDIDRLLVHLSDHDACGSKLTSKNENSKNGIAAALGQAYRSPVKVLLVGIGADEQVAGYGRHRDTYLRGGWEDLRAELDMDMDRIWQRNLGRDDRMIADHGREGRFPYLDEHVIAYLRDTPLQHVADFTKPRGIGDKLILRIVARQLGLRHCTGLPKQAIQFGTRIAKLSNERTGEHRAKGTTAFQIPAT
ncbi:hypothetical protein AeNC1_015862 [Aphanomyces euteiches]|nr:hypothetical protein AeNC1_015862 [Aphanomyces euteiches]